MAEIKKSKKHMTFDEWFELAKEYKEKHGNLLVPSKYVTETGKSLGKWIVSQRQNYANGKLSIDKIKKLESIGMVWQVVKQNDWQDMLALASLYKKEHGNLLIPTNYITPDGKPLGRWIKQQRAFYQKNKLSKERIEKLENIGMVWTARKDYWDKMFKLATDYSEKHGNLNVPKNYVTPEGEPLGNWINAQRKNYNSIKTLTDDQIKKLSSIGMIWQLQLELQKNWSDMYKLAEKYYSVNNDLTVPRTYEAENGAPLGRWIATNRSSYAKGKLSFERISKLERIGIAWQLVEHDWDKKFEVARAYYLKHGDLLSHENCMLPAYKSLTSWLGVQRRSYKKGQLSIERIKN